MKTEEEIREAINFAKRQKLTHLDHKIIQAELDERIRILEWVLK